MREMDESLYTKSGDAWAEFLGRYYWDMYITANFSKHLMDMKPMNAIKFIRESFIGKLYKPEITLSWFAVIENYKLGGVHSHMFLTIQPGYYDYAELGGIWRNACGVRSDDGKTVIEPAGYSKIESYDHSRGAGGYVAKYITKDMCAWDFKLNDVHKWENVIKYITDVNCPENNSRINRIVGEWDKVQRKDYN